MLAFKDAAELDAEGGRIALHLVTEPATPLLPTIARLGGTPDQATECVSIGLHSVAQAVAFLNNDCKLVSL